MSREINPDAEAKIASSAKMSDEFTQAVCASVYNRVLRKQIEDAQKAEQQAETESLMNTMLDSIIGKMKAKMQALYKARQEDLPNVLVGDVFFEELFSGVKGMDFEGFSTFDTYLTRGLAARRTSGIPGMDHA